MFLVVGWFEVWLLLIRLSTSVSDSRSSDRMVVFYAGFDPQFSHGTILFHLRYGAILNEAWVPGSNRLSNPDVGDVMRPGFTVSLGAEQAFLGDVFTLQEIVVVAIKGDADRL